MPALQENELQPPFPPVPRSMQFALFATGLLWVLGAGSAAGQAAQGIATRLNLPAIEPLLQESFFLFLLLVGFAALSWIALRRGAILNTNALPPRATAAREWRLGAALGWAMLLVAVLPMVLAGSLHPQFWLAARAWGLALLALATLAAGTLALEVAFRGYIYRRLIDAIGQTLATLLLSLIYAIGASFRPNATGLSFIVTFATGLLFSLAYLRTHALWLGWGLHFAWDASMGVLLGLPVAGLATYSSVVTTNSSGLPWLTGEAYGPEAALVTVVVLAVAMALLYRMTRDYAWAYTHPPIVAAGYPMTVAPPPAHIAMEAEAAGRPTPLVQIVATTSTTSSTLPVIQEHLRTGSGPGGPTSRE